jgi:hypothetical protein
LKSIEDRCRWVRWPGDKLRRRLEGWAATRLPTHLRILAAPRARAFAKIHSRHARGRREGRVPARTHGPRATKKHAAEPQVQPASGLPRAMVLRLIRDLPGDHAWLPPSSARRVSVFANLAPASERQDHTTSPSAQTPLVAQKKCARRCASTASRLHVRDDRETPLSVRRDDEIHKSDFSRTRSDLFFAEGVDRNSRMPPVGQITFVKGCGKPLFRSLKSPPVNPCAPHRESGIPFCDSDDDRHKGDG